MKALITGVTGFVGSHLAEHLQAQGDAVLGIARGTQAPVAWDISQEESPSESSRRQIVEFAPDVIFHLAAVSVPAICGRDAPTPEALATNVEGTRRVQALAQSLPRPPRVVFMSSSHVYAPVPLDRTSVDEDAPLGPVNAYGLTKLTGEQLCRVARTVSGLDFVIVRSFILSGPRQDGRLMLPEWAAQFVRGGDGPIEVRSLDVTIDLLDVRDAVRALRQIAIHAASGSVYNVGSGRSRTTGELFQLLATAAGSSNREVRQLKPGRRSDPIADVRRLVALTGWSPQVPIEQTVADVLDDVRRRTMKTP